MSIMKAGSSVIIILVSALSIARCQTPGSRPLAAYSSGDSVSLVSRAGKVVSTIKLPVKVGEFTFSPDLKKLVVVTPHPGEAGGRMYLYSLASGRLQRIPAHAVLPQSGRTEVYSDPQFSPDGTQLFFSTHSQAEGDLYETGGPIAKLDLKSLRANVLPWTIEVFTDDPMLSPSGREFFLPDEEQVVDTNGTTLFDFHDLKLEKPFKWAFDVAWVGNSCVLDEEGKSAYYPLKSETSYFVLDLKTLKNVSTVKILGLPDRELAGLVSYKFPYAIVKGTEDLAGNQESAYFLVSPGGSRTKVAPGDAAVVQVLPNNRTGDLPTECR